MSFVHNEHKARKRFGQNFLNDEYIINSIVDLINPSNEDVLIEIGPGLGALTRPTLDKVSHLNVIELDKDLVTRLKDDKKLSHKLSIFEADALTFDFSQFYKKNKKIRVFGNLPYNISTPLIFHLLTFHSLFLDMHFMLQKEVVNRMCAQPNSKAYGRLSVMTQYFCSVTPVLEVPPSSFTPQPKVDSAIVRLLPFDKIAQPTKSIKLLEKVTKIAFSQRRKTIRNSLKSLFEPDELISYGFDLKLRPENLTVEHYIYLSNKLFEKSQKI